MREILDVAPYLLRDDGVRIPAHYLGEKPRYYVDAIIDVWGKKLCNVCVENWFGKLIDKRPCFGLAHETHPKVPANEEERARGKREVSPRVWWYEKMLTDDERRFAYDYLREPTCTPERHSWGENQDLCRLRAQFTQAARALAVAEARAPGWSIKGDQA